MAKFQVTVGRLTLEGREYYPVRDALRKVTQIVKVLCLEGTQGKRASWGLEGQVLSKV